MATSSTSEKSWSLSVRCPHCELQGTIPWERLTPKKRVRCRRCEQWFRVESGGAVTKAEAPDAAITVAVRGALSEWKEHLAPESGRLERRATQTDGWRLPFGWRTGSALGAALLALLTMSWLSLRAGAASDAEPAPYQEPERLEDRAAAFTASWAGHDTPGMVQFTTPGKTTPLMTWLHGARLAPVFVETEVRDVKAEVVKVEPQKDPHRAMVTVAIALRSATAPPPPKSAVGYTHREVWTEVAGKWFFAPEETCKALQAAPGVQWR
jgi:hypothetical protein